MTVILRYQIVVFEYYLENCDFKSQSFFSLKYNNLTSKLKCQIRKDCIFGFGIKS